MTKVDTHTFEYNHCGECPEVLDYHDTGKKGHRCGKLKRVRILGDIWGPIPSFCPLPDKKYEFQAPDLGRQVLTFTKHVRKIHPKKYKAGWIILLPGENIQPSPDILFSVMRIYIREDDFGIRAIKFKYSH